MMPRNTKVLEVSFRFSSSWSHVVFFSLSLALIMHPWHLLVSLLTVESNDTRGTTDNLGIILCFQNKSQQHDGVCTSPSCSRFYSFHNLGHKTKKIGLLNEKNNRHYLRMICQNNLLNRKIFTRSKIFISVLSSSSQKKN